jgi:hypothetical protein
MFLCIIFQKKKNGANTRRVYKHKFKIQNEEREAERHKKIQTENKKGWETRNKQKLASISESVAHVAKQEFEDPPTLDQKGLGVS